MKTISHNIRFPGYREVFHSPLSVPLLFWAGMIMLSPIHSVFTEWGGVMQYFAGKEIFSGAGYRGWTSHLWPPLFSILIGVTSKIFSGFFSGKLISISCASFLLYVIYHFAVDLNGQTRFGLWSQRFLAVNPAYVYESLQAHNHMLDSFLFVSAVYLYIKTFQSSSMWGIFLLGIVSGLAGLTRYSSYVLLFLPMTLFVFLDWKNAVKKYINFIIGFVFVSSPWWYHNYQLNGSPFYNLRYQDIYIGVVRKPEFGVSWHALWRSAGVSEIKGVYDIVSKYPYEYIKNFINNIPLCIDSISTGSLGIFLLPAFFDNMVSLREKHAVFLYFGLFLSIMLVSQSFVNPWFLLNWAIIMSVLNLNFMLRYVEIIENKYNYLAKNSFNKIVLFVFISINILLSVKELRSYKLEESRYVPLIESTAVTDAMKAYDPEIENKVIMAIDPGRVYYTGAKYLMTPLEYNGSIEEMVRYGGLYERYKKYAPKYPSTMDLSNLRVDYLIYTNPAKVPSTRYLHDLYEFKFLMDPSSKTIPSNFKNIYKSEYVMVYKIDYI